jgi:hypothetical protein
VLARIAAAAGFSAKGGKWCVLEVIYARNVDGSLLITAWIILYGIALRMVVFVVELIA